MPKYVSWASFNLKREYKMLFLYNSYTSATFLQSWLKLIEWINWFSKQLLTWNENNHTQQIQYIHTMTETFTLLTLPLRDIILLKWCFSQNPDSWWLTLNYQMVFKIKEKSGPSFYYSANVIYVWIPLAYMNIYYN